MHMPVLATHDVIWLFAKLLTTLLNSAARRPPRGDGGYLEYYVQNSELMLWNLMTHLHAGGYILFSVVDSTMFCESS